MKLNEILLPEFDNEMRTTRRVLNELSEDFFEYRPHERSWSTKELATHIIRIPTWVNGTLDLPELDFATAEIPEIEAKDKNELLQHFDTNVANARVLIEKATNEQMLADWTLRNGDKVFFTMPRMAVLRSMVISHIIHHRAQLGVYLCMNDAKVPASYGDSADEKNPFS